MEKIHGLLTGVVIERFLGEIERLYAEIGRFSSLIERFPQKIERLATWSSINQKENQIKYLVLSTTIIDIFSYTSLLNNPQDNYHLILHLSHLSQYPTVSSTHHVDVHA